MLYMPINSPVSCSSKLERPIQVARSALTTNWNCCWGMLQYDDTEELSVISNSIDTDLGFLMEPDIPSAFFLPSSLNPKPEHLKENTDPPYMGASGDAGSLELGIDLAYAPNPKP